MIENMVNQQNKTTAKIHKIYFSHYGAKSEKEGNDNIFVILTERMDKTDILNLYPCERKKYHLTAFV